MIKDTNTHNISEDVGTYIFVPLYNVEIDSNVLGKEFHGFDIISTSQFLNEYSPRFQTYGLSYQSLQLDWALQHHIGALEKYPVPKFIIRTGAKLPHIVDSKTNNQAHNIIKQGFNCIVNYLMAMRLYRTGNIQIERYYVVSPEMTGTGFLTESTVREYIVLSDGYSNECWSKYKITKDDIKNIVALCKKMNSVIDIISIPLAYFQEYYSAKNTFDKILKLVTVWECSILNDCRSELTYKLQIRGSKILGENASKFFNIAYSLRSDIVHTGKPSNDFQKQLKKFLNVSDDKNLADMLLIFIRDYMEPVTRKVLLYFIDEASRTHANLEKIAKSIDIDVFDTFEI